MSKSYSAPETRKSYAEEIQKFRNDGKKLLKKYYHWSITSIFYQALHLLDALIVTIGLVRPERHRHRTEILQMHFPNLYESYYTIFNLSIKARYYPELLAAGNEDLVQKEFKIYYSAWKIEFDSN